MAFTVWFTGLPAAGKTTLGRKLYNLISNLGHGVELLDSDYMDYRIVKNLGTKPEDRDTRVRMMAYAASLLNRHHIISLVVSTSPAKETRNEIAMLFDKFVEVFVNCPIEVAKKRDPKGLYAMSEKNIVQGFTGVDALYTAPDLPALTVNTDKESPDESVDTIFQYLIDHGYLPPRPSS